MGSEPDRRRARWPRWRLSESNVLVILAVVIGLAGGLSAVGLEKLLDLFDHLFFGIVDELGFLGRYKIALAPVLGGLIAGPLIYRFALEAKGHGVPEVMEAVALKGGRIRPRVAIVKALASAITIGSGGSAGREGPIVQIGATLGSSIAQVFKMSDRRTRTLVAAGAASGIAAAFNAPLAGVFFALEVILQRFDTRGFATVVLSAVTSSLVWRAFFGNAPVFKVPFYSLNHPVEVLFYIGLGIAAAISAVIFVQVLYWVEDRFESLPILGDLKPAMGAAVAGGLGVYSVLLLGTGINGINEALSGSHTAAFLLLLLGGKILATSFTLGSGGSGGIFSPSLFIGAMLGAAYGIGLNEVFPGTAGPVGAYAMVGMAAVFAGAAQAPMTSILILFEMTNDYRIMLPLMLAVVTSTVVYSMLKKDSVYMAKLRRRGVDLSQGRDTHLLETIPLARVFTRDEVTITLPATVEDAIVLFEELNDETALVVDDSGRLIGMITLADARRAQEQSQSDLDPFVRRDIPAATIEESLDAGLRKMAPQDLTVLPVVDENGLLVGRATRQAILRAYVNALGESEGHRPPD